MIRKLIQISPSTTVVSLPAAWIKKNKLSKKSEVKLEESDNRIIISSSESKSEKQPVKEKKEIEQGKEARGAVTETEAKREEKEGEEDQQDHERAQIRRQKGQIQ